MRRDRLRYVVRDAVGPYDIVPLTLPGLRSPNGGGGVTPVRRRTAQVHVRATVRTNGASGRKLQTLGHGASRITQPRAERRREDDCAPRCFLVLDVRVFFGACIEAAGSHNALRSVRPFGRKFG